jgi:hypothetical protein
MTLSLGPISPAGGLAGSLIPAASPPLPRCPLPVFMLPPPPHALHFPCTCPQAQMAELTCEADVLRERNDSLTRQLVDMRLRHNEHEYESQCAQQAALAPRHSMPSGPSLMQRGEGSQTGSLLDGQTSSAASTCSGPAGAPAAVVRRGGQREGTLGRRLRQSSQQGQVAPGSPGRLAIQHQQEQQQEPQLRGKPRRLRTVASRSNRDLSENSRSEPLATTRPMRRIMASSPGTYMDAPAWQQELCFQTPCHPSHRTTSFRLSANSSLLRVSEVPVNTAPDGVGLSRAPWHCID